jgi:hypothetical protein
MKGRARLIGAALAAAVLGSVLLSGTTAADDGGKPYRLAMSGANEFNGAGVPINVHGDADQGSITLRLNPGQEEVCWSVDALSLTAGEALPHVAHIHLAPAGDAGPVVIDLFGGNAPVPAPTSYPTGTTCVPASRDAILAVIHDPSAYYVNLHNAQHPGGVARAQLG